MLKKIGFAALAVVAGLFILNSTHMGGYAKTAWHKVKKSAKGQVPLEFQLESARNEIAQLIPDMKKHIGVIAEETIAVKRLKEEIVATRDKLNEQRARMDTMKDDLKKGEVKIFYGGQFYSADRVRDKLERDLASCKRCEKELESREAMLDAKERALEAAREQLGSMRGEKEKLELLVAQMEAELKTLRVAQTRNKFQLDDSRLANIKATLDDIRTQMKVEQAKNELYGEFCNDLIPVEKKASAQSTEQLIRDVEAYLGDNKPDGKVATSSVKP